MKNLIFCDIDGTILDSSRGMDTFSDKTRYAINQLRETDYIVISSGRCKGLLTKDIKSLNPSGYILCNGAYSEINNEELYTLYFDNNDLNHIVGIVEEYEGFYILESIDDFVIKNTNNLAFERFMSCWGTGFNEFEASNQDYEKYNIGMVGFLDDAICDKAYDKLAEYASVEKHNISASFDINIKGVNKAIGVDRVREYLKIDYENTYAFGDGINDIQMLKAVAHPVIMANSNKQLKQYNFEETDDVLDDGFYNYLVKHKLIKPI